MQFGLWLKSTWHAKKLHETTIEQMYNLTRQAFPNTTRRENSIDEIKIENISLMPYVGTRTLFIKGLANNHGRHYYPIIMFKSVSYGQQDDPNLVEVIANNGVHYFMSPLDKEVNDILVRCDCLDFKYRGNYYDWVDGSLWGRVRTKYERITPLPPVGRPYANPLESPMICKHLWKLSLAIQDSGLLL